MMKNARWLCDYSRGQLGRPYWYGTFGQVANETLLKQKRAQYPNYYDQSKYKVKFESQLGQKVHDCSGLIKGALWCNEIDGKPIYDSTQDLGANGFINNGCTETGDISSIPNIAGLLVWRSGHIGIYEGNGYVLEARGHDYGVIRSKLSDGNWKKWGKCKWVIYGAAPQPEPQPTPVSNKTCTLTALVCKKGTKDPAVKNLQLLLNGKGFTGKEAQKLTIDGDFGSSTDYAVRNFQLAKNLEVDGIVGSKTWEALLK